MTKAELIQFLEPFEDDIKLVTVDIDSPMRDFTLTYDCRKWLFRTPTGTLIENGEGYIKICPK